MILDEEYYGCRKWDQHQNRDAIRKADAKFRQEALKRQGREARRFVPGGQSVVRKTG